MTEPPTTRRGLLKAAGLAVASACLSEPLPAAEAGRGDPPARPNILLIIADDQTFTDSGCYGHKDVRTPNIDRLAAEGMRFTRAFTATAMCAPTRQQLYTGIFPVRNGAYPNHSRVYDGVKSIVHHLRALGYRVGLSGKRHFGPPESFPFESVPRDGMAAFLSRDPRQPYCLIVASHSPHPPWTAGDAGAYDAATLSLPPYMVDTPETRRALTQYYAEVTAFDGEVGQCMDLVAKSGRREETLFLYTSEQGAQFPHGKWTCYDVGLQVALVIRWPARVKAGSVTDAMVQYVDVVPTLIEAAGGKAVDGLDGRSFLGVLTGTAKTHRDAVFGVHTTRGIIAGSECYPIRSIRTETHKYIMNLNAESAFHNITMAGKDQGGYWPSWVAKAKTDEKAARWVRNYQHRPPEELYDVVADPYELNNLAAGPAHRALMDSLRKRLEAWMSQQGDRGKETEMKARERQGRKQGTTAQEKPARPGKGRSKSK